MFPHTLSGNHLSYVVDDLCDPENEVKVTQLVFASHWCSCVPYLVRICTMFLQILSGNHLSYVGALNDLCDLENEVKVTQFELGLCLFLVLQCTKFGEDMSNVSRDIEWKPSFISGRLK